jgi:hypothetical protein
VVTIDLEKLPEEFRLATAGVQGGATGFELMQTQFKGQRNTCCSNWCGWWKSFWLEQDRHSVAVPPRPAAQADCLLNGAARWWQRTQHHRFPFS